MSRIYKFLIVILVSIIFAKYAFCQRLIIERALSKVLVERENLVKAKIDALKDAKIKVILQAVARFVDYESMIAIEPLLKKYFLEKPDIFIESIRIIKEGNSIDLSEFSLQIETQIYKSKILYAIRNLGLPSIKEKTPIRKVLLIYNANSAMRKKGVNFQVLKNLQKRLNPYRIKAKFLDIKNKYLPIEMGLKTRLEYLNNSNLANTFSNNLALLELNIQLSPKKSKSENDRIEVKLIFWPHNQEMYVSKNNFIETNVNVNYKTWNAEKIIPEILDTLMIKWTPIIHKTIDFNEGGGKNLTINFFGISGPNEEQMLYKTLFQNNSNWKEILLDKISLNNVSYKGIFTGNQKDILKSFNTFNHSPFKILNSYQDKNNLFIKTSWRENYANLERYQDSFGEKNLIVNGLDKEKYIKPIFQVPLSTFKKTYSLPFSSSVLDNIRHRGDSTLFKIDWPQKKDTNKNDIFLRIYWQRIGPSNLSPKITLLDKNKKRIKLFYTGKKKQITFEHQLPKDRKIYFIRISDEIGFLEDVAGSYQSFKYILTVKQN